MQTPWAIDLGTTNTLIARWQGTHAETIQLDDICECELAWQTPLILRSSSSRIRASGYIGKQALAADEVMRQTFAGRLTPVARSFKRTLGRASQQAVAEYGHQPISARQTATVFLKELLKKTVERERLFTTSSIPKWNFPRRFVAWARREGLVNDLTMTCPVDSFEPYRMELQNIARKLGVQKFKTIDEPVAAALGYGVDLVEDRHLLVVDFGGGTLDIALVRTNLARTGERESAPATARPSLSPRAGSISAERRWMSGSRKWHCARCPRTRIRCARYPRPGGNGQEGAFGQSPHYGSNFL